MANKLDANGLEINELADIVTAITDGTLDAPGLKMIYGSDINVDSDTPDGQQINIFALIVRDLLELLEQVYTAKDPDQAIGQDLDAGAQYCGITRVAGTYSTVSVTVTADRTVALYGLDDLDNSPFTISDDEGNKWDLITSVSASSGANTLTFQAQELGAVTALASTLVNIDTPTLGITAVTNAAAATAGVDEESDADFRIRRQKAIATPGQGNFANLYSGLSSVIGITDFAVYENNTAGTVDGIPAHGIWVIAEGGTDADIADIIYKYRGGGQPMTGSEDVDITQIDGSTFTVLFDRAVEERLYLNLTVAHLTGTLDDDALKAYINANYSPLLYAKANVSDIIALINEYDANIAVSVCEVSVNNSDFYSNLTPLSKQNKFKIAVADIAVTEV
jgi:uncharacterized phage protein gp47/JayE